MDRPRNIMKIRTEKNEIVKALKRVEKAVATDTNIPVLSGIKFIAAKGRLTLTATNLEIAIQTVAEVEVIREGSIVLPAKYIVELFKRMPDTEIYIDSETPERATIFYGKSRTEFNGYSPNDFPGFPAINDAKTFSVAGSLLKKGIQRVAFASSENLSQQVFRGTLFEIQNNDLTLVATDTFRLAHQKMSVENANDCKFIVPTKVLNELARLIENEMEIKIAVSDKYATFEMGNTIVLSRLIEGKFPNYRQIVPQSFLARCTVKTQDFLEATDRTMIITPSTHSRPTMKIQVNGKLQILAENSTGKINEEILAEIEGLDGEELTTTHDSKFLLECLKACDFERTTLGLTGTKSPCIIRPVGDDSYFSIIVPHIKK